MKKTYIYIVLAAAAMAASVLGVSCVRELEHPVSLQGDHTAISLAPVCASPMTKADDPLTEDGNPDYNENLIFDYYWFLYKDAAGTNLVLCGHETGYETESEHNRYAKKIILDNYFPDGGTVYVYVVANLPVKPASPVEGDEWFEPDVDNDGINVGIKYMVQGNPEATKTFKTFTELKTLSFGKNTPLDAKNAITAGQSEFYKYTSATTGYPEPDRFVMRTPAPKAYELVLRNDVEVKPELKRVASKIILDLHVAKEVKQTYFVGSSEFYKKSWAADMEHIQIYMLWGSTHGNLAGDKVSYSTEQSKWFFSASPRYAMYTTEPYVGGKYVDGQGVLGSVCQDSIKTNNAYLVKSTVWEDVYEVTVDEPTTTANGWIWNNGVSDSDKTAAHEGDYYYGNWNYTLDGNGNKIHVLDEESGNNARRSTTQTSKKSYYEISSLPLYSMPIRWNVNDDHAPFIKVILPWQGFKRAGDMGDGDPIEGSYDAKTTEFYYKILIPQRTYIDANGCYHISVELSVLGSESDDVPVEVEGQYHVTAWNAAKDMGGDQNAGRYLKCASYYEFYARDVMEIPVISSHDIEVVLQDGQSASQIAKYYNYSTHPFDSLYLTRSTNDLSAGNNFVLEASANNLVTIKHACEPVIDDMQQWDVSPITYTFRIRHADNANFYKDVTVVQYPSLYIRSQESSKHNNYTYGGYNYWGYLQDYASSNFYNQGYVWIDNDYYYGSYKGYYTYNDRRYEVYTKDSDKWYFVQGITVSSDNTIQTGSNQNPNMYIITTTVLDPSLNAVLGDPRMDVIDNLDSFAASDSHAFQTAQATDGTTRTLSYYYPTDRTSRTENMIAPSFRIASSYGKCGQSSSFENMQARCAAYQEEGYPAGRWRVPTKAELQYITTLSAKGLIPSLFNTIASSEQQSTTSERSRYYSAHGLVKVNMDGTVSPNQMEEPSGWVRCVYDDWYWKDDKVAINTFRWGDRAR